VDTFARVRRSGERSESPAHRSRICTGGPDTGNRMEIQSRRQVRAAHSRQSGLYSECPPTNAGMAELADAADSKSADPCGHGGSTPPPGTNLRSADSTDYAVSFPQLHVAPLLPLEGRCMFRVVRPATPRDFRRLAQHSRQLSTMVWSFHNIEKLSVVTSKVRLWLVVVVSGCRNLCQPSRPSNLAEKDFLAAASSEARSTEVPYQDDVIRGVSSSHYKLLAID
jgi:hypothetical protein